MKKSTGQDLLRIFLFLLVLIAFCTAVRPVNAKRGLAFARFREATYGRAAILHVEEVLEEPYKDRGMDPTAWRMRLRSRLTCFANRLVKLAAVGHSMELRILENEIESLLLWASETSSTNPVDPAWLSSLSKRVLPAKIEVDRLKARLDHIGAAAGLSRFIVGIARSKGQGVDELACSKIFEKLLKWELRPRRRRDSFDVLYTP